MVHGVVLATQVWTHKDYLPYLPDVLLIWAPNDCNVISGSSLSFCGFRRSWVRLPAEPLKTSSHHIWLYLPYRHVSHVECSDKSDSSVGKSVHVTSRWTFLQKCHKATLSCHLLKVLQLIWFRLALLYLQSVFIHQVHTLHITLICVLTDLTLS